MPIFGKLDINVACFSVEYEQTTNNAACFSVEYEWTTNYLVLIELKTFYLK